MNLLLSAGANVNELLLEESDESLATGMKVEAFSEEEWLVGTVVRVRLNGTYDVDFDNGKSETGLGRAAIRYYGVRDVLKC